MQHLSDKQIQEIRSWMPEIHSISDFQTKLNTTFQLHLTYLETRFLMDDLNLQLAKVPETPKKQESLENESSPENLTGSVNVSIDPVTRPGYVINGNVTFSDGQTASWSLDQMGRLGLKPTQTGYRPSQEDIVSFQEILQQKISELSQKNAYQL